MYMIDKNGRIKQDRRTAMEHAERIMRELVIPDENGNYISRMEAMINVLAERCVTTAYERDIRLMLDILGETPGGKKDGTAVPQIIYNIGKVDDCE